MSEVLPSKLVHVGSTVLGHGALILLALENGALTYGQLWLEVRGREPRLSYVAFVDAATFLFSAGLVEDQSGAIARSVR